VAKTGRPKRYCSVRCRMVAYRRRHREPREHKWAVLYRSRTCEWSTPRDLFARLNARYGPFDLDPCATPENATCARFYTAAEDGLARPWAGRVFCNPPYGGAIASWLRKARQEVESGSAAVAVLLVPSRTGARWWQDHVIGAGAEVEFLPGRLRFGGGKDSAPFDSALVVFRNTESPALALRNQDAG
jgi:site-specific DNA-methyltransferase (adenine-specific)